MIEYAIFPYDKVLNYLKNNVSDENLQVLFDKYNITNKDIEVLADIISDDDMLNLGYESPSEIKNDSISEFTYSDINDIIDFLCTKVDVTTLNKLFEHYDCYCCSDLALALTDMELQDLGYCCNDKEQCIDCYDREYRDYDENLDYLEDIPDYLVYDFVDKNDNVFITSDEQNFECFRNNLNPVLVDDCFILDKIKEGIVFKVLPTKYTEVSEEVIINDTLNPELFDENGKMIQDIREQLVNYVMGFINDMNDKKIKIDYGDICLVGSNAGYLYTPESDIDIHIISSNPLNINDAENLYAECDIYETENPLLIDNRKVELGIEDSYENTMNNENSRRYSIIDDLWVNESDKNEIFTQDDLVQVEGYDDVVDTYTKQINDVIAADNYPLALKLKQEIRQNRSNDLANLGSLSMGNVVFKELRNNGSYGKLKEYIYYKELGNDNNE